MEKLLKEIEKNPKKHLNEISDKNLEKILDSASDYYYNKEPILSDDTYDSLENELKKRNPGSKHFQRIGAPVRKDIVKTELPSWMGSLDKIYPNTRGFDLWFEKNKGPFFVTQKLDGASGMISYQNGDIKIYTRGDGRVGQDISFLKDYLNIPKIKESIVIRGEFIMSKYTFLKKYKDKYPKARTAVNSVINSKKPEKEIIRNIRFVVYEVIEKNGRKWSDQFKILKKLGFLLPDYIVVPNLSEPILRKIYLDWKQVSEYEIDGLVISKDAKYVRYIEGNPKYSVAFKVNLEGKKTTIEKVLWDVSKHGIIKPRVKFDMIVLDGDNVNYATAFNAKFIEENNIGPGTVIKIIKSGDVIPYILSIEKSTKVQFPEVKYHWNETHVDIILDDLESSDDYKIKRILHFFQTLRIPNISIGIVTKLYSFGYDTPKKICLMKVADFITLPGIQEKSGRKLFESIKSVVVNPIPLERIMTASLVFDKGFGEKRLKSILEVYPNFMKIYKSLKVKDIEKIEGFSEKTSKLFVKNIPDFIKFITDLSFLKIKLEEKKSGTLNGLIFVFSGFRDTELKEKIENQGGNVRDTVSTKTSYLIVKKIEKNPTGKIKKANDLGISIISETDFEKKYNF